MWNKNKINLHGNQFNFNLLSLPFSFFFFFFFSRVFPSFFCSIKVYRVFVVVVFVKLRNEMKWKESMTFDYDIRWMTIFTYSFTYCIFTLLLVRHFHFGDITNKQQQKKIYYYYGPHTHTHNSFASFALILFSLVVWLVGLLVWYSGCLFHLWWSFKMTRKKCSFFQFKFHQI